MAKAGASADAVSFTRELYKQSGGDVGIMTGFQAVGPVDFAWISYPLRANTNYGLLLVNGKPPMVNVEDLKVLDRKTMEASPQFKDLKAQVSEGRCMAGRSRWKDLAQLTANRPEWRDASLRWGIR